jgi:hypothetical protein
MAEIRTDVAVVKRLAGAKGVVVAETHQKRDGSGTVDEYYTVWLGEGHGLRVGDRARFYGKHSKKVTEKNGHTYVDVVLNEGQVVSEVERAQQQDANAAGWDAAPPADGGWQ